MNLQGISIVQNNITVVFEKLDLDLIDRNALRALVPNHAPVITEIPDEMIVMIYPTLNIAVQWGERRLRVTDNSQKPVGEQPLAEITAACCKLVESRLDAYGFNYNITMSVEGVQDTGAFMRDRFLQNPASIQERIDAKIHSVGLRVHFTRNETVYQLTVDPEDSKRLRAHYNAHYDSKAELPSGAILSEMLKREYEGFVVTLQAL